MTDVTGRNTDEAEGWFPWLFAIASILMLINVIWEASTESGSFDLWHLGKDLVGELAVAVFIGWVISVGIERASRLRDAREAESRRQAISENVVSGVFGVQYPSDYVKAVIDAHLSPRIVRLRYDASYIIRHLTDAECAELCVQPDRFVAFSATRSFIYKNVSSRPINFPVLASIPIRRSEKLRGFTQMRNVTLDGVPLKEKEISAAIRRTPDIDDHRSYCWQRRIAAGRELSVVFESLMIKELSDTELWWNAHPTLEGARFSVNVPRGMNFDLQAVSSNDLVKEFVSEKDGNGTWKIDGPVLSNESVQFWWRSPEDDGKPEQPCAGTVIVAGR